MTLRFCIGSISTYRQFAGIIVSSTKNECRGGNVRSRLLIVDDDRALLKMLGNYFTIKGYDVQSAVTGKEAIEKCFNGTDLILLDINLPGMDGLEVCREIRNRVTCPILFLTAKVEEQDRVNGLLSGGDDYILKPFSLKELEARITAHLNREERRRGDYRYYSRNGLIINYTTREVQLEGKVINLTKTEYAIIELLSRNPKQVFDRELIYEKVCGFDAEGDSRSITELMRRIRKKLAAYSSTEFIETVWGVGYRWTG